jgi:hypothetical protein
MAIDLSSLILDVRSNISDIPEEYAGDNQIYRDLKRAKAFVTKIAVADVDEDYLTECYIALATLYTYINYTSMAERQLGTLPPTALVRVQALRKIAAGFLQLISAIPLTEDLTVDMALMAKTPGCGYVNTHSCIE